MNDVRGAFSGIMAQMVGMQLSAQGRDDEILSFISPSPGPDDVPCPHCGRMLKHSQLTDGDGLFVVWNLFPDPCDNPACVAIAEAEQEANAQAEKAEKERKHRVIVDSIVRNAGVPRSYIHATFGSYDRVTPLLGRVREQVQVYVRDFRSHLSTGAGLYLAGSPGTGKTHLAAAALRALAERETRGMIFTSSMDLLDRLKQTYDAASVTSETDLIEDYKQAPLLVIDDLGKEYGTTWAMTRLSDIIHARYAEGRPMIITSNYALDDIGHVLSRNGANTSAQAIESRLQGCMMSIAVVGEDYRKRQKIWEDTDGQDQF